MKIGILGGTFDPIHKTHIYMAKETLKQLKLDKVYIMPSPCPPHKNTKNITSDFHRVNMIKLAVANEKNIELFDYELKNHLSYTADTLTKLKSEHKEDDLYFIIGGDSAATFTSWYQPAVILKNANLVIINRKDENQFNIESIVEKIKEEVAANVYLLNVKESDISSSDIRTHKIEAAKDLLPKGVYEYIVENNLYTDGNINKAWSLSKIKADLKNILNKHRYEHTLGVAETAKKMAEAFNVNPNTAYLAGILHDCAKYYSDSQLLKCCKDNNILVTDYEEKAPYLLHGKVGAFIAKTKYGIVDENVLNAVIWHTTGKENMSDLEKIIFCADYIEPGRIVQPNLENLRSISLQNLDLLTYSILKDTLDYLKSKNQIIDSYTQKAFDYYKNKLGE